MFKHPFAASLVFGLYFITYSIGVSQNKFDHSKMEDLITSLKLCYLITNSTETINQVFDPKAIIEHDFHQVNRERMQNSPEDHETVYKRPIEYFKHLWFTVINLSDVEISNINLTSNHIKPGPVQSSFFISYEITYTGTVNLGESGKAPIRNPSKLRLAYLKTDKNGDYKISKIQYYDPDLPIEPPILIIEEDVVELGEVVDPVEEDIIPIDESPPIIVKKKSPRISLPIFTEDYTGNKYLGVSYAKRSFKINHGWGISDRSILSVGLTDLAFSVPSNIKQSGIMNPNSYYGVNGFENHTISEFLNETNSMDFHDFLDLLDNKYYMENDLFEYSYFSPGFGLNIEYKYYLLNNFGITAGVDVIWAKTNNVYKAKRSYYLAGLIRSYEKGFKNINTGDLYSKIGETKLLFPIQYGIFVKIWKFNMGVSMIHLLQPENERFSMLSLNLALQYQ